MRPIVDYSQLRALLFCREVLEKDSGITLVDVHDTRFSPTFPACFDELTLFISFEALRAEPIHLDLYVTLPDATERQLVASLDTQVDETLVVIKTLPMAPVEFVRPGTYNFGLYVNQVLIGSTRIEVVYPPSLAGHGVHSKN